MAGFQNDQRQHFIMISTQACLTHRQCTTCLLKNVIVNIKSKGWLEMWLSGSFCLASTRLSLMPGIKKKVSFKM